LVLDYYTVDLKGQEKSVPVCVHPLANVNRLILSNTLQFFSFLFC